VLLVTGAVGLAVIAAAKVGLSQKDDNQPEGLRITPPNWAYAVNPPSSKDDRRAESIDHSLRHVPNSDAAFRLEQTVDLFTVPDWHPEGHSAMPEIVAHGRKPQIFACGYCHLPNGFGRPENSDLAGLPVAYIVQQMSDFKHGLRKTSVSGFLPAVTMAKYEPLATDEEIAQAANYFSGIKPKQWIRVVETDSVPKTHVAGWMLVLSEPKEMEPIGQRIIETPINLERTELRDDTSGFMAYVPTGSIAKGKALATTGGNGKTVACFTCHGKDLGGLANVPRLAGRSPSYVVRQIVDMQNGVRIGAGAGLMKPVVANLGMEDIITIAAYIASINP
jgi:cytochrome c553